MMKGSRAQLLRSGERPAVAQVRAATHAAAGQSSGSGLDVPLHVPPAVDCAALGLAVRPLRLVIHLDFGEIQADAIPSERRHLRAIRSTARTEIRTSVSLIFKYSNCVPPALRSVISPSFRVLAGGALLEEHRRRLIGVVHEAEIRERRLARAAAAAV